MDRTTRIAMLARLYMLLGRHPEFMTTNTGELVSRVMDAPVPLNSVDKTLVMGATEIDRLCAHTVMVLRGQMSRSLLDVIGILDPDRIVAMYYALPDRHRNQVKKDAAWGYHVEHAPPELADVLRDGSGWLDADDRYTADRTRLGSLPEYVAERLSRTEKALLAQNAAGLALQVTQSDWDYIQESERIGQRYIENVGRIGEELTKLDDPDDPEAVDAAIDRVLGI
ncbi:MAG TPA: hypothetical protein VH081_07015 [Solirubrobacteraceae bacterium]|jgi:hypothetical protein|nr:hypothetical protein [Solirubrobacteraceae bacterium]